MNLTTTRHLLLIIFLVNFILKFLYLGTESISHDEPFSIYHAQFDVSALVTYLKGYNNPPLYEIVLHGWIKLFGISEISVRFMPMLFSCFSAVFIYKIGKEFFNHRIAVLSSLIFTFSTFQTWYAHDSRVYTLFLLLTSVSFYLFYKLLHETINNKQITILVFINALILYAHYFGLFVWFVECLIIILFQLKNRKLVSRYFIINGIAFLLYIPQIVIMYQRFVESSSNGTWLKEPIGIESLYNMIWSFSNAPVVAVVCISFLLIALIKQLISRNKERNPFTIYTIIWFFVPFLLMFFISYKIPMFLDRYLIFATPAFYILISVAINYLFNKPVAFYISSVIISGLFIATFKINPSKKRSVKDTINYITSKKGTRTVVLVCPTDFNTTFAYYYNKEFFKSIRQDSEYGQMSDLMKGDNIYFINQIDQNIMNTINQFDNILYLDAGADFAMPHNNIKNFMQTHFNQTEEKHFPELFNAYIFKRIP